MCVCVCIYSLVCGSSSLHQLTKIKDNDNNNNYYVIIILTGSILPNSKLRNVDLPTPLGPTTATNNDNI